MNEETLVGGSAEPRVESEDDLSNGSSSEHSPAEEALERAESADDLGPYDPKRLRGEDHRQDIRLKRTYARWLLILVAAQLFVADAIFVAYAWAGEHWRLDAGVVQFWLGATLVELIGVVAVITRYLFPRRDQSGI